MSTSNIRVANLARAKIIYNKNKETYKIVIAFNVFPRENDRGDIVDLNGANWSLQFICEQLYQTTPSAS